MRRFIVVCFSKYISSLVLQVTRVEEYYNWLENTFIPYLYPGKWYNGDPYKKQFVADNEPSRIISMARMRQLRVKRSKFSLLYRLGVSQEDCSMDIRLDIHSDVIMNGCHGSRTMSRGP